MSDNDLHQLRASLLNQMRKAQQQNAANDRVHLNHAHLLSLRSSPNSCQCSRQGDGRAVGERSAELKDAKGIPAAGFKI